MITEQERQERFDKVMERDARYEKIFFRLIYVPILPSLCLLIAGLILHNLVVALTGVGIFVACCLVAILICILAIRSLGKEMGLLKKELAHHLKLN